ncbi:MAG TPA: cation:proton antiporter [Propionibacteriaceae bacterium]|nr:cation:proton antiporter [Propionibacteriaceae bacterium]
MRRDRATTGRAGAPQTAAGGGAALGSRRPHQTQRPRLASSDEAIELSHELGLGMLFLLAGYEVELKELTGRGGHRARVTWLICVGLAFAIVWLIGLIGAVNAEVPVAIALTSTALGTLLPILQDSGQLGTRFSDAIMNHGAGGSSARRSPWRAHTSSW